MNESEIGGVKIDPRTISAWFFSILVLLAIVEGLYYTASQFNTAGLPLGIKEPLDAVILFLLSLPFTFIVGVLRNVTGFLYKYFKSKYKEEYDFSRFLSTWMYYAGFFGTASAIVAILPEPWNAIIGAAVAFTALVVDFAGSRIKNLLT